MEAIIIRRFKDILFNIYYHEVYANLSIAGRFYILYMKQVTIIVKDLVLVDRLYI